MYNLNERFHKAISKTACIFITRSRHQPMHLLCNSHVCEAFDRGNLSVLKEIESSIGLKDILTSMLPELKSFLFGKSCTESALLAFTRIAINTGHQSSLYLEFEKIIADNGKSKKFSLFKERRFCLLGYTAAAVLYHLQDFKDLLATTKSNNLLVLACRIYVENEFLLSCFAALAYFTYRVTFPYFNFCEKSTQIEAREVFPQLFKDLECMKVDTLDDFRVNYSFDVREMQTDIEKAIMNQFCLQASKDFKLQKGREYGFNNIQNERATNLAALSKEQIQGVPLTNMPCERQFGQMDHLLQRSAKTASKNFKALGNIFIINFINLENFTNTISGIQNEMILRNYDQSILDYDAKKIRSIRKLLDSQQKEYSKRQEEIFEKSILKSHCDQQKTVEKNHALLMCCKTWGGPCTNIQEFNMCVKLCQMKKIPLKKMLKTEISFRKVTSPRDVIERPALYKLNTLSIEKLQENLTILLTTEFRNVLEMPSASNILNVIRNAFDNA